MLYRRAARARTHAPGVRTFSKTTPVPYRMYTGIHRILSYPDSIVYSRIVDTVVESTIAQFSSGVSASRILTEKFVVSRLQLSVEPEIQPRARRKFDSSTNTGEAPLEAGAGRAGERAGGSAVFR